MHMADALVSAAVGGTMIVASGVAGAYSIKKIQNDMDEKKIPLMGVMGAFVFAAQMINFTIPGTGSSGHIGGGILLAALLGPYAGFLSMAAILLIQALFFGDGGLLAYGCNLFNMGFFTCFIAYPLIYKKFIKKGITSNRLFGGSLISVVIGLQMGAFSVVLQTLLSGKTELPFGTFLALMQPIHLAIGAIEGLITAAVLAFVWKARPEILERSVNGEAYGNINIRRISAWFLLAVLIVGGALSWFASANPDGLEWAIEKTAGTAEIKSDGEVHKILSDVQDKTAVLPDYGFKNAESENVVGENVKASVVNAGTSVSGIVGGTLTLGLAVLTGCIIRFSKKKNNINV